MAAIRDSLRPGGGRQLPAPVGQAQQAGDGGAGAGHVGVALAQFGDPLGHLGPAAQLAGPAAVGGITRRLIGGDRVQPFGATASEALISQLFQGRHLHIATYRGHRVKAKNTSCRRSLTAATVERE